MGKIIQTIALVVMIVLFIPAGLITVSGNAVPGDFTYPLKRKLEDAVLFLASFNSYSKAYFAVAQSNRRYEETVSLLKAGTDSAKSLEELVSQTSQAADNIKSIRSSSSRARLFADLSDSIEKYDQGLEQAQQQIVIGSEDNPQPTPPKSSSLPLPPSSTQPTSSPGTQTTSRSTRAGPGDQGSKQSDAIEKTRRELEELKRRLEEEKKRLEDEATRERLNDNIPPSPSPGSAESGRSLQSPEASIRTPDLSGPEREEREREEREEKEREERERGSGNSQGHGSER